MSIYYLILYIKSFCPWLYTHKRASSRVTFMCWEMKKFFICWLIFLFLIYALFCLLKQTGSTIDGTKEHQKENCLWEKLFRKARTNETNLNETNLKLWIAVGSSFEINRYRFLIVIALTMQRNLRSRLASGWASSRTSLCSPFSVVRYKIKVVTDYLYTLSTRQFLV